MHLRVLGVTGQLRFVAAPGLRFGAHFGGFQRFHHQVHRQRRGRELDDVRGRHRQAQQRVRRGLADAVLEQAAHPRLVIDGHHRGLETVGQARPPQHPARDRGAHSRSGGADAHRFGGQQQPVARQSVSARDPRLRVSV